MIRASRTPFLAVAALVVLASHATAQVRRPALAGSVASDFAFSADGAHVVFRSDARRPGTFELFAAPADGSVTARRLSATLPAGGDVTRFAPGTVRVAYLADQYANDVFELYSVPITGGAAPLALSGALVPGGDVLALHVTPDGTQVVFLADALVDGDEEFFRVPIDGSAAPVALDPAPDGLPIVGHWLHPAGTHLFFTQRDMVIGPPFEFDQFRDTLFVLALQGAPSKVELADAHFANGPFVLDVTGSSLVDVRVTPDGTRAVYIDYIIGKDGTDEIVLNSVPMDGSEPHVVLSQGTQNIDFGFEVTPSGRIVYAEGDLDGVYSIQADGTDRHDLTPATWNATVVFGLSPDGTEVCFYAWRYEGSVVKGALWSVPVDGSAPATELDQRTEMYVDEIVVTETSVAYVARLTQASQAPRELYGVDRSGAFAPLLLAPAAFTGTGASLLTRAPDERALFRYAATTSRDFELHLAPADASLAARRISGPMSGERDLHVYALSPDGERVVYSADQRIDEISELFTTTLSSTVPPVPFRLLERREF
jgi:hypothetical protein